MIGAGRQPVDPAAAETEMANRVRRQHADDGRCGYCPEVGDQQTRCEMLAVWLPVIVKLPPAD